MTCEPLTAGRLAAALATAFPLEWAEDWDRVGLLTGDADAVLSGVLVTLDATAEAVERTVALGANCLVTHHPPYLELPLQVRRTSGPGGTLEAALRLGVAVIAMHTNLDRSPEGASALPGALGLREITPLESAAEHVALVVTYAPRDSVEAIISSMATAGAGRIGEYERCAFTSEGRGRFAPLGSAEPFVPGDGEGAAEVRIEMVASPSAVEAVLAAARAVHPYEEPVIVATDGVRARGVARLGRVCEWTPGATLGELAEHASQNLGAACRVWGDAASVVSRIAVANGSAGSLLDDALKEASVLVCGEVRYHDALAAHARGLAIIEAGHDASEWPLVGVLGRVVADLARGVKIAVEEPQIPWWISEVLHDGR